MTTGPDLPALGLVTVAELRSMLVDRHGFGRQEAQSALALGMLLSGYPADHGDVSGVDAFDVMDYAIHHHRM